MEEDADDPVTLSRYLVFALGRVTSIGEDLLHELDGLHPRMRIAAAGLAAAIAGVDAPCVLVVDDVHRLADRRCFALLRALAREVPSGSEIVFAARSETPLALARVRASGELLELGIDDLRFGLDDAADLLRAAGAGDIGAEDVARLTDLTEGWAVGLYLAARSLAANPATVPTFSGDDRGVADYLRETMLADLPAHEVEFLIQTDAADREMEAVRALLIATMGREGVGRMREDAERATSLLPAGSPWRPNASLLTGLGHLCGGELEPAAHAFGIAVDLAGEIGVPIVWALAHAELAIVALQLGDVAGAATNASSARRVVEEGKLQGYPTSELTYAVGARVALVQGDSVRARACAEEAASIDPVLSYAMPVLALQADLLLARCAMGLGDGAWAEGFLTHADDVIAHRPDLGTLVPAVAAARDELDMLRTSATGAPSLTPAEARLLPLLTTHLSFREIGAELFVSPHTVKTQAISIYRKLGVSSRAEAVNVAREIGLLTP